MSIYDGTLDLARAGYSAVRDYENPLVTKELRTRMRAGRAHWTMLVYVLILSVVLFAVYYSVWIESMHSGGVSNWAQRRVGLNMFTFLAWCQMALLALIGPSLTAGCLTLEHEQQTIEMLSLTSLSPRNIIVGKVGAPAVFLWMLLASSLPLAGLCLLFGGISPIEIVITYVLLAVWAFLFCALGVFWSSVAAKTSAASLLTYGTGAAYVILTLMLAGASLIPGGRMNLVLEGLNPAQMAREALAVGEVFYVPVPLALVSFIVNLELGLLLLTAAQTHLKYHRPDKALAVRLQLLGLSAFILLMFFGSMVRFMSYGTGIRFGHDLCTVFLTAIMLVVFVFLPPFASGVIRNGHGPAGLFSYVASGFSSRRLFSQDLSGGLPFILLWIALLTAVGTLALGWAGAVAVIPDFWAAAVSVAAVAVGYYCFGVMVSTFANTRNLAMALTFLFIIITFVFCPVIFSNYAYGDRTYRTMYELVYFWPALPLVFLQNEFRADTLGPTLQIDPHIHWFAVSVCYLALSCIFLWIAGHCRNRCKGVVDE